MSAEVQMFRAVIVRNPFDASDQVAVDVPVENKTIQQLVARAPGEFVVSINGGIVPENEYDLTTPVAGDCIVIVPVPQGGGGKNILRLVAIIALTYVTGGIASGAIGGLSGGAAFAAAAAVQIGGTMLINALLPPPMPSVDGFKQDNVEDSPTYGIDGAKNTSTEGIPVPLCYGRHRMAGNVIALHSENVNDSQNLYMLINAGEGEIDGIEDVMINDQAINLFDEVSTEIRTGTAGQSAIGWFNRTIKPMSVGVKMSNQYTERDTSDEVDAIRVDVTFPNGLLIVDEKSGKRKTNSVEIEVILQGLGGVLPDQAYLYPSAPNNVWTRKVTISAKQGTALRRSIAIDGLREQKYRVKVRRTKAENTSQFHAESVYLTDINEIINERVRYKHTALLGLKIKLTDQLNGVPNVTYINRGIKIKVWNTATNAWVRKASSNPAWIVYDILTNTRYGGNVPESQIDLYKFREWAKFCDENDLDFNGVIDGSASLWDAMQPVLRVGHAKLVMMGTKYTLAIEKPDTPVMMFSQANIIKGTFSNEWLSMSDRTNEVEIRYYDKNDNYKQRSVKLYDEQAISRGQVQRMSSLTLPGVTDAKQAQYEAMLALNLNKYIRQTVSFDAYIDSIACTIGSVIYVQHDMPKWGYSGRIRPGSTTSRLKVEESLGDSNKILIRYSARKLYTCTVSSVVGDIVYLNGFDGKRPVKRLTASGGREVGIADVTFKSGSGWAVIVSEGISLAVGNTVELWDTDVMEERDFVIDLSGDILLAQPLPQVPDAWADFMAGKSDKFKKPFRVTSITGNGEMVRTISAIEYNHSIYERDSTWIKTPNYSSLRKLDHSEILGVDEELVKASGNNDTVLTVVFDNKHPNYLNSEVQVSFNGGKSYSSVGRGIGEITFNGTTNAELIIRVLAKGISGEVVDVKTAPRLHYTVIGRNAPPANVGNLRYRMALGGIELIWDKVDEPDVRGYGIREGLSWESGKVVNELVQTTSTFIPISEPKEYEFHVRAIDGDGNMSESPTSINISLAKPTLVTGFNVVRNGEQLNMLWDRLDDQNIMEYEIREGRSWSESVLITKRVGNTYTMPSMMTGARTFWIKARHFSGMESEIAAFATVMEHIDRYVNVIFEQDHDALSWPGLAKSMTESADSAKMVMSNGVSYSEYHATVSLPDTFTAHNSVGILMTAQVSENLTFADMTFDFGDGQANRPFTYQGDMDLISGKVMLSQFNGVAKGIEAFSFDNTAASYDGSHSFNLSKPGYTQGRFKNGVIANPVRKTELLYSIPSQYRLQAWHRVTGGITFGTSVFWQFRFGGIKYGYVYYDVSKRKVIALWPDDVKIELNHTIKTNEEFLIMLIQTATERKLMVGRMDGYHATGKVSAKPIGAIDKLNFAH